MLDDRITVDTPEGVRLELTLAGLGTRILAAAIDAIVQGALLAAVVFGAVAIGSSVTADLGFLFLGLRQAAVHQAIQPAGAQQQPTPRDPARHLTLLQLRLACTCVGDKLDEPIVDVVC